MGNIFSISIETASGNVNWDDELLLAVRAIKNAPDNDSFNDTLLPMLNNAGVYFVRIHMDGIVVSELLVKH